MDFQWTKKNFLILTFFSFKNFKRKMGISFDLLALKCSFFRLKKDQKDSKDKALNVLKK